VATVAADVPGRLLAARLTAQLLAGEPAGTPEAVAERLLAVQAQDPRGFRLAVRGRTSGVTATDVEAALTQRRSLVVTWLNRGTLHLVTAEDYWWLQPLTTPQLRTGNVRRLRQEGVDEEPAIRGLAVVEAAVAEGPQTRAELRGRLDAAGVPTRGQALVHVLFAAALEGLAVRGPVVRGEQAYVSPAAWLGPPPARLDPDAALARLAQRYLCGHGPATAADLGRWAGIPLGPARSGLAALDDTVDLGDGLVDLADRPPPAPLPPPRLLGTFEPLLLGWADRTPVLGRHERLITVNGLFRPLVLVRGRVVGTWGLSAGVVSVTMLDEAPSAALTSLRRDADDLLAFFGLPPTETRVRTEAQP
jgi:hypothetical protein